MCRPYRGKLEWGYPHLLVSHHSGTHPEIPTMLGSLSSKWKRLGDQHWTYLVHPKALRNDAINFSLFLHVHFSCSGSGSFIRHIEGEWNRVAHKLYLEPSGSHPSHLPSDSESVDLGWTLLVWISSKLLSGADCWTKGYTWYCIDMEKANWIQQWAEHRYSLLCIFFPSSAYVLPLCLSEASTLPKHVTLLEKEWKEQKVVICRRFMNKIFSHPVQCKVTLQDSAPRICLPEFRDELWHTSELLNDGEGGSNNWIEHKQLKIWVPLNRCKS